MKNKIKSIIMAAVILVSLSGCATTNQTSANTSSSITTLSTEVTSDLINTAEALETTTIENTTTVETSDSQTQIQLSGSDATITGTGATITKGILLISHGGTYTLTGNFTGSIIITAPKTVEVELILDGVNIIANKNSAIYCTQAGLLTITLAEGSTNSVTDSTNFTFTDTTAEEPDATIFSKVDLTIGGTGSLKVIATYNNGIGTKDDLVITGGVFEVTAANHGLRGRDSITILGGDFTINSVADGIQSNNDEDVSKGWILLEGGTYNITAGNDAIQAETILTISAGTYNLKTGNGNTATSLDTASSYKGLKATTNMIILGGNFIIDSADDTVHSNGNIAIMGGIFSLSSGDDGVHADGDLTISGTDTQINIITAYEGLEAKTMTISDGIISMNTQDDGINIAGGNDTTTGGTFGKDSFSGGNSGQWLLISGGNITVNAGADAIDINGSGQMTGGTVNITAALLGEGQTLDVDGTWELTGGELTESGGGGMGGGGRGRK